MDRDAYIFGKLVKYLRAGAKQVPKLVDPLEESKFLNELKYWSIEQPEELVEKSLSRRFPNDLVKLLK